MPTLYMMIGLPASGKSTFRKTMSGQILSTDDYIHEYAKEHNTTYMGIFKEAAPAAETKMNDDLLFAVENNWDIVWDQTNLTKKARAKKLAKIPKTYRKVAIYVACPESSVWRQRLDDRKDQQIPSHVLASMAKQMEFPTRSEGFDEIQVVVNGAIERNWA